MWTKWHILIPAELHRKRQRWSLSIMRQKNLQCKTQWKSRGFKEHYNMDNSKGNSSKSSFKPNMQIFLSYSVTKPRRLGVWCPCFPTLTCCNRFASLHMCSAHLCLWGTPWGDTRKSCLIRLPSLRFNKIERKRKPNQQLYGLRCH